MGFFDSLKAICDTRRWYTQDNLYNYFACEITGHTDPHNYKDSITTNIRKILKDYVNEYYPSANMNKSGTKITDGKIAKISDEIYKMNFKGVISVYNSYDDYLGTLYFNVVVHADKYADLSKNSNQRTTVNASKEPLN